MKHILHLSYFPSIADALAAINSLDSAFLKAHKRKSNTDLTVTTTSNYIEVRCHYEKEHRAEAAWFERYLQENPV